MRRRSGVALAVLAFLGGAAILASSAEGASSGGITVTIPLPPVGQSQVSEILVKSAGPPRVSAINATQLGGKQLNTQAVAAISKKPSGDQYKVFVIVHHWPPARRVAVTGSRRRASGEDYIDILFSGGALHIGARLNALPCTGPRNPTFGEDSLQAEGLTTDAGWGLFNVANLIPSNNTAAEEQVDNAVALKCTGAEKDDPGST